MDAIKKKELIQELSNLVGNKSTYTFVMVDGEIYRGKIVDAKPYKVVIRVIDYEKKIYIDEWLTYARIKEFYNEDSYCMSRIKNGFINKDVKPYKNK